MKLSASLPQLTSALVPAISTITVRSSKQPGFCSPNRGPAWNQLCKSWNRGQ